MSPAEVFGNAAKELRARGLRRLDPEDKSGASGGYFGKNQLVEGGAWPAGPCDIYAAVLVASGLPNTQTGRRAFWDQYTPPLIRAHEQLHPGPEGPGRWCDRPEVTVEDVCAVYERAAVISSVHQVLVSPESIIVPRVKGLLADVPVSNPHIGDKFEVEFDSASAVSLDPEAFVRRVIGLLPKSKKKTKAKRKGRK